MKEIQSNNLENGTTNETKTDVIGISERVKEEDKICGSKKKSERNKNTTKKSPTKRNVRWCLSHIPNAHRKLEMISKKLQVQNRKRTQAVEHTPSNESFARMLSFQPFRLFGLLLTMTYSAFCVFFFLIFRSARAELHTFGRFNGLNRSLWMFTRYTSQNIRIHSPRW